MDQIQFLNLQKHERDLNFCHQEIKRQTMENKRMKVKKIADKQCTMCKVKRQEY